MVFRMHDVKRYEQCPKKFWLQHHHQDVGFPYIYFGYPYVELAKEYLRIQEDDCFVGQARQTTAETLAGFASKTWLMKGRFEAKQLRAQINFLKRLSIEEQDAYRVLHPALPHDTMLVDYYVLCRTNHPRQEEGYRIAMETWLLQQCGITVRHHQLIHLNGSYVRQGELDVEALFCLSPNFFKDENKVGKLVGDIVAKHFHDLTPTLQAMAATLEMDEVVMPYHTNCTKHGKCQFYEHCFKEEDLPDNSILFLSQTRKKYDMLADGIETIDQIDLDSFDLSYLQYAQYQAAKTGNVYVDEMALAQWLSTHLEEPLSFIDFEWDTLAIPLYDGMRPYDVLVFQYSLHVLQHGKLTHHEFIQTKDGRRDFIESLLSHIPSTGSIIAYHAEGAEKLRLKELAQQFPEYAVGLLTMCDRMIDLTYPFVNGVVYYPKMRGTFSLKKLLSVIEPDHNYAQLEVNHGLQAVAVYRELDRMDALERTVAIAQLKEYCSLDTYAMYVVLKDLQRLVSSTEHQAKRIGPVDNASLDS